MYCFMFKKTKLFSFGLLLALAMVLAACGGADDGDVDTGGADEGTVDEGTADDNGELLLELGQENLSIPYVAWARETISTHLLAAILEDVGYNVDIKQVEAGPMFTGVAEGTEDFHTSAWLPATHASYWEEYEDDLVKVTEVLDKAPLALTVPSYVEDINSIEDLKDNTEFGDSVDWKIIGIDPGAGIMQYTQKVIEEYGIYTWEVIESSEDTM